MENGMSRIQHKSPDTAFICSCCGRTVLPHTSGSRQRNHCPFCLWSSHVDIQTGDRRSLCRGGMKPLSVFA
ncbi:MAG: RNHCP domain-containing protein, partial [Spirochaetota bacterium]